MYPPKGNANSFQVAGGGYWELGNFPPKMPHLGTLKISLIEVGGFSGIEKSSLETDLGPQVSPGLRFVLTGVIFREERRCLSPMVVGPKKCQNVLKKYFLQRKTQHFRYITNIFDMYIFKMAICVSILQVSKKCRHCRFVNFIHESHFVG